MFKIKVKILDKDWKTIDTYKSYVKPSYGEFIYSQPKEKYYKINKVIHWLGGDCDLIVEVEEVQNLIF